jgi:hypothetical protein
LALKVIKAFKVRREAKGHRALLAILARRELKVFKAPKVFRGLKVFKALRAIRAFKDLPTGTPPRLRVL